MFLRAAQLAKTFISLAVFCTYGLQFFVCLEIAWAKIQDKYEKATTFHNYLLRTVLVTISGKRILILFIFKKCIIPNQIIIKYIFFIFVLKSNIYQKCITGM